MAEFVARLVEENESIKHLNELAWLSTDGFMMIKRKFVSTTGWEHAPIPLADVERLEHFDERPITTILAGVAILAIGFVVIGGMAASWNDLSPETRIPIGAIVFFLAAGVKRAFSARRHRLVVHLRDGKRVSWASRAGEFKNKTAAVEAIVEFARGRGWNLAVRA